MDFQEFDEFARETAGAPTRRTVVRGLAAMLGAVGLGAGLALEADAGKKSKKRKRRRKRKNKKKQCDFKGRVCATPLNVCQTVTCEKHKCVNSTLPNGADCGGGRKCTDGVCNCPAGKTCEVNVSPSAMNGWLGYDDLEDKQDDSIITFVAGPGNPPHGDGSVQMSVEDELRYNIATYQFSGTELAEITQLKFTTYNPSSSNNVGPDACGYLHFNVDFDGSDNWQRRLVYVPVNNGNVKADQWQEWDAISNGNANWILSGGLWPDDNLPNTTQKTWDQILTQYPGVRIRVTDAFLGVRIGEPYQAGFTGNVGSLTLATGTSNTRFVFGPDA
ncbi:MAG: hypothetical protein KC442_12760 [Thermomicrobiales bacterium]|nr:hypothetical protein [Thermomicrobiales bacterium]